MAQSAIAPGDHMWFSSWVLASSGFGGGAVTTGAAGGGAAQAASPARSAQAARMRRLLDICEFSPSSPAWATSRAAPEASLKGAIRSTLFCQWTIGRSANPIALYVLGAAMRKIEEAAHLAQCAKSLRRAMISA